MEYQRHEFLTVTAPNYLLEENNFLQTIIEFQKMEGWQLISIEHQHTLHEEGRLIKNKNLNFSRPKTNI
jgi:hypothetical protein